MCVSGGIRSVAGSQEFEILVQGSLEEPANSIEGLKRLEMLVGGGDGAGLEDLAPVQQAPVAAAKAPVKERKKGVGFAAHVVSDGNVDAGVAGVDRSSQWQCVLCCATGAQYQRRCATQPKLPYRPYHHIACASPLVCRSTTTAPRATRGPSRRLRGRATSPCPR